MEKSFSRITTLSRSTLFFSILLITQARAQVLFYNFNESGTSAINSGSGGTTYNLSILNSSGAATDLHSSSGSNFYGGTGKYLDLSSASGMGSGATAGNPSAYSASAGNVLSGATSFTVAGWHDALSSPSNSARLLQVGNILLYCNGSALSFQYGSDIVNSNSTATGNITSASGSALNYNLSNQPVFFAISYSYDSLGNAKTVTFYIGDSSSSSTLSSYTVTYTPTSTTLTGLTSLIIGGNATGASNTRPFDGYIDDFAIYTSVVDSSTLNTLRVNELLGIPEPPFTAYAGFVPIVLLLFIKYRQKIPTLSLH